MWSIYDRLIDGIVTDIVVTEIQENEHWIVVNSEDSLQNQYAGIAMSMKGGQTTRKLDNRSCTGMTLKELAHYVKSWNFSDASIGMAAINTYYNQIAQVNEKMRWLDENDKDAFTVFKEQIKGKNVAVIGHFPNVKSLAQECNLTVLERNLVGDDLPDSVCEYVLSYQDYVFITGTTLTNKTCPRLLELANNRFVVMIGPSVPVSNILFEFGVNCIGGSIINNHMKLKKAIAGNTDDIFSEGMLRVQFIPYPSFTER
ncbi:hypothetical protein J27TS8_22310 [Robertmurraya siralis]|uniref:Heavy-metal chelation domain-containing protein n=1 Tax=Robertmurraya siralis TaxID=77777 RepID=A0A920BTS0_9BACI|nr:DUF364 domain-containing protein [Robertmurraya siralis]GIN62238.1 hypothetical protein J27TS8_22310 [Robertmurraya siralis]